MSIFKKQLAKFLPKRSGFAYFDVWVSGTTRKLLHSRFLATAEVPDLPDNVQKAADSVGKVSKAFDKSREDCEAKLLELQNSNDAVRNSLKQFEAKIEKNDFKLDSKNKEALKKIQKARKLLTDKLNGGMKIGTMRIRCWMS